MFRFCPIDKILIMVGRQTRKAQQQILDLLLEEKKFRKKKLPKDMISLFQKNTKYFKVVSNLGTVN